MSERIEEFKRKSAEADEGLFIWCLTTLKKFPPTQGEWREEVKRPHLGIDDLRLRFDLRFELLKAGAAIRLPFIVHASQDRCCRLPSGGDTRYS